MKILFISHHFLPRHRAGVEVYCNGIARELQAGGDEVCVLTTDDRPGLAPYQLLDEHQEGLRVMSITHPRVVRSQDDSLGVLEVRPLVAEALDRFMPDVVHIQHLMYIGLSACRAIEARGIPMAMTLHEYWLLCARGGQFLQEDGTRCERAERDTCATCLTTHRFGRTPVEAKAANISARVKKWLRIDPFPLLKRIQQARDQRRHLRAESAAESESKVRALDAFLERRETAVAEVRELVSEFLCPSDFLRTKFIDAGWPAHKLRTSRCGIPVEATVKDGHSDGNLGHRETGDALRVGFIGSLIPQKGVDVLVTAAGLCRSGSLTLEIHGSTNASPKYTKRLQDQISGLSDPSMVELKGAFKGGSALKVLQSIDVLVVPSIWFENAPLVIFEAFAAGVPVVASRLGGMAEMVQDGVDGLLFETGEGSDLARVLQNLADHPERLSELSANICPPRKVADDAKGLRALYAELAASRKKRNPRHEPGRGHSESGALPS